MNIKNSRPNNPNFDNMEVSAYNPRPRWEVRFSMVNTFTFFYSKHQYFAKREKLAVGYKKKVLPALMSGLCRALMYLFA